MQVLQNHNLLIALGGVAARRSSATPHFSMPVSNHTGHPVFPTKHISLTHHILLSHFPQTFFEPHFLRASQYADESGGQLEDGLMGSGEEIVGGEDDNSNNSLSLMARHDDMDDDDDNHDDDDDDENGDTSNLPLNLVATQFAE